MVGDLRRDIHWKSVARTGNLMVKDRSRVGDTQSVHVVIDVADRSQSADEVDELLGQCRTAVEAFITRGYVVTMTSVEFARNGSGLVHTITERVASYDEVGQRLARVCDIQGPNAAMTPDGRVLRVSGDGLNWDGPGA